MTTNIEKIFFIEGSFHPFISEYLSHNALPLAEKGVVIPKSGLRNSSPVLRDHCPITNALNAGDIALLLQTLQAAEKEVASTTSRSDTLCFVLPGMLFYAAESVDILKKLCKQIFPAATVNIFLPVIRQDMMFCRMSAVLSHIRGINYYSLIDYKTNLIDYSKIFRQLKAETSKNLVLYTPQNQETSSAQDIAASLHMALGFNKVAAEAAAKNFHPQYDIMASREVLHFVALTVFSAQELTSSDLRLPWLTQLRHFTPESGYAPDTHSLLGPGRRAEILGRFAASNADAARMLGVERLFPDPEPEPNWQPWPGLTEETAFRIAERLDPDFAAARLAELDAAPRQYLNYEQRLCQQALRNALAPVYTAFPPHTPVPQPRLSVLTLTYNHAAYIAECIESVLAQKTDFPFQHIIADDASDDGTQDIILDYAARYPHIVPVFQKERSHGPKNVRALFDMARTEYVALCDGDDYFSDPAKLQTQVDFLKAHKDCALCFHPVRVLYEGDPDKERVYPPPEVLPRGVRPFYYLADLLRNNLIQTNSAVYRWRFQNGLPDWFRADLTPGDRYWHILHAERGKIGYLDTVMSVYRRHKGAVYYLAEVDKLKHRHTVALQELTVYDVLNAHFERCYASIFLDLANGVFADCLLYCEKIDDFTLLDTLTGRFPLFARNFLDALDI